MSTNTTRLGLATTVGSDLVSNYPSIDSSAKAILDNAAIWSSGTLVARPAANAVAAGTYYLATDDTTGGANGTIYWSNGSSWDVVGGSALSIPKPLTPWLWARVDSSTTTVMRKIANVRSLDVNGATAAAALDTMVYLKGTEFTAGSRTTKYQLVAAVGTNAVAPACNITVALNTASAYDQGSSGNPSGFQVNTTAVSGSSITFTTPGAVHSIIGDDPTSVGVTFTAPSAGFFAVTVAVSGTPAAGSVTEVLAQLRLVQT